MFEQFRKIFPTSAINLKDITHAIGLNEEELRTKGLERIQAVKSEFQNLNAILTNRPPTFSRQTSTVSVTKVEEARPESNLSLVETIKLAQRFDAQYEETKALNEKNLDISSKADDLFICFLRYCEEQIESCTMLQQEMTGLNEMKSGLEEIASHAASLQGKMTKLEEILDVLTNKSEIQQFDEWKRQQEWDFQIYMAEKRQELDNKKKTNEKLFIQHVQDQEKKRLELIQANFEWEIEDFRKRKDIEFGHSYNPQVSTHKNALSLENFNLDASEDQRDALNQFLEDENQPMTAVASLKEIAAWDRRIHEADHDSGEDDSTVGLVAADEDYED